MKTIINYLVLVAAICFTLKTYGQQTAMQFSGDDCNGNYVNLFDDLDASKAVVLHFYMPNCGSCPPPAQKIQAMAMKINATYQGAVKGYAFPFQNSTTCAYSANWVNVSGVSALYTPMDSGATQVAYYGGFGMPTVVLLGGADHRVMFVTQSFISSDTTIMRDSILNLLNTTGINKFSDFVSKVLIYPNPVKETLSIECYLKKPAHVKIDIVNETGNKIMDVADEKQIEDQLTRLISTSKLAGGVYFVRVVAGNYTSNYKFVVAH